MIDDSSVVKTLWVMWHVLEPIFAVIGLIAIILVCFYFGILFYELRKMDKVDQS